MKRTSRPCSGSIRTPVYSEAYPVLASDSFPKYSRNGAIIVTNMRRSIVYKPLQEHPQLPSKAVNTLKLADGHPAFRNAIHEFAWCSVRWEPWAREYYYRKRKEGKTHHVAIRSLANNWVRIIFAMWKTGTTYNPTVFREAQAKHYQNIA